MIRSEFEDEYTASIEDEQHQRLGEALLSEPIRVVEPGEPFVVGADATVMEAVTLMNDRRAGCVVVVEGGRLVGIFTERDVLRRVVPLGRDPGATRVGDVMTRDPETLSPDDGIAYALNLMSEGRYRHIPLVDSDGRPVAVVSVKDFVRWLVALFPESVLNLPPEPRLRHPEELDGG